VSLPALPVQLVVTGAAHEVVVVFVAVDLVVAVTA